MRRKKKDYPVQPSRIHQGDARRRFRGHLVLAFILTTVAGCEGSRPGRADGEIVFLEESELAYRVASIINEVSGPKAEPLELWAITDMVTTDDGFVLTQPLTQRIMFFDWDLSLMWETGREGRAPGEYLSPGLLARGRDGFAVFDAGLLRVSRLTPNGEFVSTSPVQSKVSDMDYHPDLGLLFASDVNAGYYLAYGPEAATPLAAVPQVLRTPEDEFSRYRSDLLAVAPDGSIHVWDGRDLALASYTREGTLTRIAYLPESRRAAHMQRRNELTEALGGPARVLASPVALRLQALSDGRVFVSLPILREDPDPVGYVIDPGTIEAMPVLLEPSDFKIRAYPKLAFTEERLLMVEWRETGLAIGELEVVPSAR